MFTRLTAPIAFAITPLAVQADGHVDPEIVALFDAMLMPQMVAIVQQEGQLYADQLADELLAGRDTSGWDEAVSALYDLDGLTDAVLTSFAASLEGSDIASMTAFFTTEPGSTIVQLELSAREARLDPAVEEAADEAAAIAIEDETARYAQITRFIEVNDLLERNVVGTLNAQAEFYLGLLDGGAMQGQVSESQLLADVWAQEGVIRNASSRWLYSFLLMAYQPLEDGDIDAYIAFSETDAGADVNAALFDAFDNVFNNISRGLGLVAADMMIVQDL